MNSILWDNEGPGNSTDADDKFAGSVDITYSDVTSLTLTDANSDGVDDVTFNMNIAPGLSANYRISDDPVSPVKDKGNDTPVNWGLDIEGEFRISYDAVDMGINELPCELDPLCPWDLDGSGHVSASDRGFISANIGCTITGACDDCFIFDLDGSGVVSASDRGFVSANIGPCPTE